jgi:hypothetical protein
MLSLTNWRKDPRDCAGKSRKAIAQSQVLLEKASNGMKRSREAIERSRLTLSRIQRRPGEQHPALTKLGCGAAGTLGRITSAAAGPTTSH